MKSLASLKDLVMQALEGQQRYVYSQTLIYALEVVHGAAQDVSEVFPVAFEQDDSLFQLECLVISISVSRNTWPQD